MTQHPSATLRGVQTSIDELGTPLSEVTFVVVDLETTGTRLEAEGITEIGAVKVRGGEVLGEFATLVDPGCAIPPMIERLTGITTSMVMAAPRIREVIPAFLEFLEDDVVLVAHNAKFDVGFLKAAFTGVQQEWPNLAVVDTVKLARGILAPGEVRNNKLGTLAAHFGAVTTPNHRALADARATVDVLHALLARVGTLGITSREDLLAFSTQVPETTRRKRHLATGLPAAPGVYIFRDAQNKPLYIGTSHNIAQRVRSYFTASEKRRGMSTMVALAENVTAIPCATALEAQVREVRLIAQHRPPFNRRSKNPEKAAWLKVTHERFPRLSVVRKKIADDATYLGPFRNSRCATDARDVLYGTRRVRQCTDRLGLTLRENACALLDLGRCDAPCTGNITQEDYAQIITNLLDELCESAGALISDVEEKLAALAATERFEEARTLRDGTLELLRGLDRYQRRRALMVHPYFVAARPGPRGGWEFTAVRHGRFVGAALCPLGKDPRETIASLELTTEQVDPPAELSDIALIEETDIVLRWYEKPGTRLVTTEGEWFLPVDGASRYLPRFEGAARSEAAQSTRRI